MSKSSTRKLSHQKIVDGFPDKYRNRLLDLLETNGSTVELLKLHVLELPNSERNAFMSLIKNFVSDEVYKIYYNAKYRDPRSVIELQRNSDESHFDYVHRYLYDRPKEYFYLEEKEIDLLSHKSPEIKEQIEDPYLQFDITDHFYPFEFPLTDSWINRKEEEFVLLPQVINNFSFSDSSLILNHSIKSYESEKYSFPKYLVEKQFKDFYDNSERIDLDQSLEEILSSHAETFHYIQQCLPAEGFKAFLYNSFCFRGNDTNLEFLNIRLNTGVSVSLFRHYLFNLYEDLEIKKPKIGFLQLICFKYARKTIGDKLQGSRDPNNHKTALDKHYQNLAKNTVSLIPDEVRKAEKKANIYPFPH